MLSSKFNHSLVCLSRTCQYLSALCNCRYHHICVPGSEMKTSAVVQQCVINPQETNIFNHKVFSSFKTSANLMDARNIPNRAKSSWAFLPLESKCCHIKKPNSGWKMAEIRTVSNYVAGMRHLESLKENDELCADAMKSGQFAVFYSLRPMVCMDEDSGRVRLVWKNANEMDKILSLCGGPKLSDAVLLNSTSRDASAPARFALHIPELDSELQTSLETALQAQAIGIRKAMFGITRGDVPDLLQAYAVLQWHSVQVFCSKCGGKTEKNESGSRRVCCRCSEVHYPTMKPVVITVVTDGDRCLVARQPQFPPGMYSALAGFCDMGETLEDAVRREVAEEVGLEVESISYASSQHWPLPSSGLMLGCYATVKADTDKEILIDQNELEDARWLTREEVQGILESRGQSSLWLPPRQAIAHHLLRGWAFPVDTWPETITDSAL